jgi:conjugative relaxase-like TrwC/TraI family protein
VLKISKPLSAQKVSDYYKFEHTAADQAYYTEGTQLVGEWHGRLAAEFELVGAVEQEQYGRLALGQHPCTGEQLIKHRLPTEDVVAWRSTDPPILAVSSAGAKPKKYVEHVAAWDWTLAPHKSYSVTALVGGDRGLIEDHKKAARLALDAGEKYTQARLRDVAPVTSANWCAALFLHDSARPVGDAPPNPHLHTHAVVFNMTNAGDKIRSVQSREWYRVQTYVAAVYQAEMAYAARLRGYELEHGRNNSTAIRGYTEEYLNAVSARTEEIQREKADKGLFGAEADERINKRLRQAKQAWEPLALWREHRAQAERYGNNPEGVVRNAREKPPLVLSEKQREIQAHRAIDFARQRLIEGNAVIDHYEIVRDALRYGLGYITLQDVERAFEQRLAQERREFCPGRPLPPQCTRRTIYHVRDAPARVE